jgi:hypothetical protein
MAMGQRRREIRPVVEAIESRALLSTGIGGASAFGANVSHSTTGSIRLHGTVHGQYLSQSRIPDVGTTYQLTGAGHVGGLGHASVTGEMHSLGFIAQGRAQGDLTLKRAGGTITLHLTALEQQAEFQALPSGFSYEITGGTGRFKAAHGTGTANLTLVPGQGVAGGFPSGQGQFTLVLTS